MSHGEGPRARPARSLASATASTYLTNLGVALLTLVNVLVQSRGLGADGRGTVVLLLNIAGLTSALTVFGIQEANANRGAADPARRPSLATNSALFALVLGGSAALVVLAIARAAPAFVAGVDMDLVLAAACMVPVVSFQTYLTFLARSAFGFTVANLAWITGGVGATGGTVLLYAVDRLTPWTAFAAWALGQLCGTGILVTYVVRRLGGFGRPDLRLGLETLGFGLRAHVGFVMNVGNNRMDQWIVGAAVGTRELGLYSVAVSVAEVLYYLPQTLVWVQRPSLVRATQSDAALQAARVTRLVLLATFPAAVALIAVAPFALPALFGSEFAAAVDDLQILTFGVFGIILMRLPGNALAARGRPGVQSLGIGIAFVLTVVLDLLLIPPLGGVGAATASLVAYSVGGVMMAAVFVRLLGVPARTLIPRGSDVGEIARAARAVLGPHTPRVP